MKLLFAECCQNLVVPHSEANKPAWCPCGAAAIWWRDPAAGLISVYSAGGPKSVSIIGLNNSLLREPFPKTTSGEEYGCIQGNAMERLIEETPSSYIFKTAKSLVIRIRPGFSNDSVFVSERPA